MIAPRPAGGNDARAYPQLTLIHDDIEDDSDLRSPTPHPLEAVGLAQGVNAGDALWALARGSLYRLSALGTRAPTGT